MNNILQIQTTIDQRESALAIAEDLVTRQLAACAQVSGPITSVYRWKGKVETAAEWTCTVKTTANLYSAVECRIRQLHSYEEPEIVASEIVATSAGYRRWLQAQVTPPNESC